MTPQIKWTIWGVAIFLILVIVISFIPIVVVGAGERGVVFNNFTGVESTVLGEGTHFRNPFAEQVIIMPVKTQATNFSEEAGTQDSQIVNVNVTINWHLNPAKVNVIYQDIGNIDAVTNNVLNNNTQDSIKAAISKYAALDIQKNRDSVASRALAILQGKMKKYDVFIDNLSITNIGFSPEFTASIEQAQVQQQKAKAAEYAVATAKANADAAVATANGQAQAQQVVQQSLTPAILEKLWIEKWDGKLPQYSTASLPIPVFNTGQ